MAENAITTCDVKRQGVFMSEQTEKTLKLLKEYNNKNDDKIDIKTYEKMSRHTTFRIGGFASLYLIPKTKEAVCAIFSVIRETGIKYYLLGNGSNLVFPDEGYDGVVISTSALSGIKIDGEKIISNSGTTLAALCKSARDNSLSGLEFAYGIPGSVGGAVYMNAGAYNGEMAFVLSESTYLDLLELRVHTIDNKAHKFGYRDSVYKHTDRFIISAEFSLRKDDRNAISERMNDFMKRRIDKQPLEYPSAGSVFKRYPGRYTGQMIEEAGLKGYTIGGAKVSEKHAGFIINQGGATASNVKNLVEYIKNTIFEKFGCELECEIIFVK